MNQADHPSPPRQAPGQDQASQQEQDSRQVDEAWPQAGRERMILSSPLCRIGTGLPEPEWELLERMDEHHVFMMGDNPALPRMPKQPKLLDFYRYRFGQIAVNHLANSARMALEDGHEEKVVLACLLHDIANGCLIRVDHGYWGAQLIAPYVDEEVAWAVQYHQALRYLPDPEVNYGYPESYKKFFGPDYVPPDYIQHDANYARRHKWYMTSRLITLYDLYFFEQQTPQDLDIFEDIIGRHFKQPKEGLGFDGSPTAHMWRTMIWPNNFL